MADLKREYVVPLRKSWLQVPIWRRSKRAVYELQFFIHKNTGAQEVKLSNHVNEYIWNKGAKSPPGKIKVIVEVKENVASVELAELPKSVLRAQEKEKQKEEKVKKAKEKKESEKAPELEQTEEEKKAEDEKKKKAKVTKEQNIAMNKK